MEGPVWHFYKAPGGGSPVHGDVEAAFGADEKGRTRLKALMKRIAYGETMKHDVRALKRGLYEARLSHDGREYRLFFAKRNGGLLALHFTGKKAKTIPKEIELARRRLADAAEDV